MNKERDSVRPSEKGAVFTTIVGGRPPGSGTSVGRIPRGIEVLVKKASVDKQFRAILLEKRAEAAPRIGLQLADAEKAMLAAIPAAQLKAIISGTKVAPQNRRAFLGKVAAAMLAAVGVGVAGCDKEPPTTKGNRPDKPPEQEPEIMVSTGIRIEPPDPNQPQDAEEEPTRILGIQPDRPSPSRGISPDRPGSKKE